ncbi:MAG: DNA polymerase I [Clostridia bacterium]|nr:DNA polymerase I [Clostridia bacterium]
MAEKKPSTVMMIDGNSILNRAFYGVRPLTTSTGIPTNAVYGFLTILFRHLDEDRPDGVGIAFDMKTKTFRHLMYDGYKAGRKGMPDELAEQLPWIKRTLAAMGFSVYEREGLEADDIIGIISKKQSGENGKCIIITGDRDELQLVDENITVKLAVTKNGVPSDDVYTPDAVKEKYGLTPDRLIDLKALMGDSSDNIPGVPGIGEKTATELLKEYGTLDGVYENLDGITKRSVHDKLAAGKDSAYMSKKLGTITTTLPENEMFPTPLPYNPDTDELKKIFTELEMTKMLDRIKSEKKSPEKRAEITEYAPEKHAFLFENEPIYIIHTLPEKEVYIKNGDEAVSADIDTVLPLTDGKKIVTHDYKALLRYSLNRGAVPVAVFDTMLAAYVVNPSRNSYGLKTVYLEMLGREADGNASWAVYLPELEKSLSDKLSEDGSAGLYSDIELPLSTVLAEMEVKGVLVDCEFLEKFGVKLDEDTEELKKEIYALAGKEFNINSTRQLGAVLFEDLLLPVKKKTKTGYSTDNDVLEALTEYHPIVELIISYRKLTKLKSTYVDGLLKAVDSDGRIHTVFTQTVTQTGRISSVEPNLQNIPVRTPLGRELRKAFKAEEGKCLVDADYSQIELRLMAHISGDRVLKESFITGEDVHARTASEVFGLPQDFITDDMRRRAKAINFGIMYGIGDYTLSQDLGVSRKQARKYIDDYLAAYPDVKRYIAETVEKAKSSGYVQTLFGRRRYVPEINASNKMLAAFGERVAMNTPIQGTAADLIKIAMIKVAERLKKAGMKSQLILQIHDELIIEAPEDEKDAAAAILREEMENAYKFDVPVIADIHTGKTWFEAKT